MAGEEAKQVESLDPEKAKKLLRSLLDGLQMTDKILVQVTARCRLPMHALLYHAPPSSG